MRGCIMISRELIWYLGGEHDFIAVPFYFCVALRVELRRNGSCSFILGGRQVFLRCFEWGGSILCVEAARSWRISLRELHPI